MGFSRQEYWMGSHALLQGIFPTQGSNLGIPHCRQILYHLRHQGRCSHAVQRGGGGGGRKEVLTPQSWPESNGSIPPNSSIPAMISVRVGISPLLPSRKLLLDGSSCHVSHQLWFPGSLEGLGQVKFRGETFWRTIPPLITWSRLIRSWLPIDLSLGCLMCFEHLVTQPLSF